MELRLLENLNGADGRSSDEAEEHSQREARVATRKSLACPAIALPTARSSDDSRERV
jgi:hypothetical protein